MRFGFLSTYPPTRCGLATFTRSLATSLPGTRTAPATIVRVLEEDEEATTPPEEGIRVDAYVRPGDLASHVEAARVLNACDAVVVQHEYGIFGGADGEEVIGILERLGVPVIVVLHTVLHSPSRSQRDVLEKVASLATATVVMTEHALETLLAAFRVDAGKVHVIPHGAALPHTHSLHRRSEVATILTWGLISPGKGLEWGIRALAGLDRRGLEAEYLIAGQTHPKVLARDGESYRESLVGLARELGVEASVGFVNRYLSSDDLAGLLGAADVVLLPYESREQATSGVLVEAIAAGIPVVATAFPHAVETLSSGAGVTVPHDDVPAMTLALEMMLRSAPDRRAEIRDGSGLSWAEVAAMYRDLARRLRAEQAA